MKAMIMAGGTGGHIFPAAAVADQLKSEGYEITWLGSLNGMEGSIVPKLGYDFNGLPVTAWHGSSIRKVLAPLNMFRAFWRSFWIITKQKPDIVIGFGGYASAPGGLAAIVRRLPLVLHEQNGIPGLTNLRLEKYAAKVLQAFPNTFRKNYEAVGNPVRENLCTMKRPTERGVGTHNALRVLILGGSQGAAIMNEVVPAALALTGNVGSFEIIHQAGKDKSASTEERYLKEGISAKVVEFVEDMAAAYSWADIVIARSGASTVSELAAVGLYSILVPYPWHKDQQQFRNAEWLSKSESAQCIAQEFFTAETLKDILNYWDAERELLSNKAEQAWNMGVRDSAQRIVKIVNELTMRKAA